MKKIPLILFLLFSISAFSQSKFRFSNSIDKAKLLHYKAMVDYKNGKEKKAIKKLKKAIRLDANNEYLIDLASIYEGKGKLKKAYNTMSRMSRKMSGSHLNMVKSIANLATYALSLDLGIQAHEGFGAAIRKMNLYRIDSAQLQSDLWNNYGMTKIFHNYRKSGEMNVHIRDLKLAKTRFEKSLEYNPDNCIAEYNLGFIQEIIDRMNWDSIHTTPSYFRSENISEIMTFPNLDCPLPKREVHEKVIEYLIREKEIVFVLDISGSMEALTPSGESRFQVMKNLVLDLLDNIDKDVDIGLLTLGQDCDAEPLVNIDINQKLSRDSLKMIVRSLQMEGMTPLNLRLERATELFSDRKIEKSIFLCSDGVNYCGENNPLNLVSTCELADDIAKKIIKIYAFSLLLESSDSYMEYAVFDCLAKATQGELIGINEKGYSVKTAFIDRPIYSLPLKKEDFILGNYTFLLPIDGRLIHDNGNESLDVISVRK